MWGTATPTGDPTSRGTVLHVVYEAQGQRILQVAYPTDAQAEH